MTSLDKLLASWKTSKIIPMDIPKGQLEEIRDALPGDTDKALFVALDNAIADRISRAA